MYAPEWESYILDGISAPSVEDLADIALQDLKKQGVSGIVCGPITTGGTGHQILNFEVFNAVIYGLKRDRCLVFDQTRYEFGLRQLAHAWEAEGNSGYYTPILTVFFARLFESGFIKRGWFIPGWKSSFGTRFERKKFEELGISINDLTLRQIKFFMSLKHPPEHVAKVVGLIEQNCTVV